MRKRMFRLNRTSFGGVLNAKNISILIGCEESQMVCKAFRERGYEAYSCDLLDCSGGHPEWHIKDDILNRLNDGWDMGIFFTPCTFSCNSGIRWMYNPNGTINRERFEQMKYYAGMLRECLNSSIPMTACENSIPHKYAIEEIGRKYDQIIQPWMFGHGETKATCLWLKNLPLLTPTNIVEGREQRVWRMAPSPQRSLLRSKTYEGVARAMAIQWGDFLIKRHDSSNNK